MLCTQLFTFTFTPATTSGGAEADPGLYMTWLSLTLKRCKFLVAEVTLLHSLDRKSTTVSSAYQPVNMQYPLCTSSNGHHITPVYPVSHHRCLRANSTVLYGPHRSPLS